MFKSLTISISVLTFILLFQEGSSSPVVAANSTNNAANATILIEEDESNKRQETEPKSFSDDIEDVIKIKDSMENAGLIRDNTGAVNKAKTSRIAGKLREKARSIDSDSADSATEGVSGAGEGLLTLVEGIKGGNWVDIVTGGLDMISSVLGMLGPMSVIASSVLSLFSMAFGLFGGATGGEESTEDMMTRVIEKALLEAKAEELRSEVNGIKRLLQSFSSSIANFRETNSLTQEQALTLYDQGFRGVAQFGVLEHYIEKWCAVGDPNTYDTPVKKGELNDMVSRCLDMVNLYCDLSVFRQIMLADMASLIAEVGIEGTPEVFMHLLRKEQKSDKKLLKFLMDPANNRDKRFVITKYFTSLTKYTTITAYLKKLSTLDLSDVETKKSARAEISKDEKFFDKKFTLVCTDIELRGNCFQFSELGAKRDASLKGWKKKVVSLYVSDGVEVQGFHRPDLQGSLFGPYYGPAVYGKVSGSKDWESMNILASETSALDLLRVCENENMDTEGVCEAIETKNYPNLGAMDKRGTAMYYVSTIRKKAKCRYSKCDVWNTGKWWCERSKRRDWEECLIGRYWSERIKSMTIPKGYKIYGYSETDYGGVEYGPLYGPSTVLKVHPSAAWKSLKMVKTTQSTTKMVQMCSEEGLKGFCDYFIANSGQTDLSNVHGVNWDSDKRIKSMMVPGSITVYTYSEKSYGGMEMGPYDGPVTITKVDGADGEEQIKSFKIMRRY